MYKNEKLQLIFVYVICLRNGYKICKSRIVLGVVTSHYVSLTKNKYTKKKSTESTKSSFVLNISPIT